MTPLSINRLFRPHAVASRNKSQYQRHPDCGTLVCFVYDPERRLPNPAAIQRDRSGHDGRLSTIVVVSPHGL